MRNAVRILVVAAIAAGTVALAAVPGGAGGQISNTFTVVKHVSGPVPTGTTFTVEVTCSSILGPAAQAPAPTVVHFDATGAPTDDNSLAVSAGQQCTATETANGGATSTGYECAITRGPTDDEGPPFLGNCTGANQATFTDVVGDSATITVTNTFPVPSPPPVQPVIPVAQAVQAAPAFTG